MLEKMSVRDGVIKKANANSQYHVLLEDVRGGRIEKCLASGVEPIDEADDFVHMSVHTRTHIHACTCTHMHTHAHTCTQTAARVSGIVSLILCVHVCV